MAPRRLPHVIEESAMPDTTSTASTLLRLEQRGAVLWVTLNRPDLRNAFNDVLITQLIDTFTEASTDDSVRCIVLAGEGKSFCAGADLKWMRSMASLGEQGNIDGAKQLAGLFEVIERCAKPVIGRIHGAAIGGGVGLVAACDIPVAEAGTKFGFSEVRLGLAPAVISPFVIRKIGPSNAREWFVTGARFTALTAKELGLANYVEDGIEAVDARISKLTEAICLGGPKAVVACKRLALEFTELPEDERRDRTAEMIAKLRVSDEGQEGMRAFLSRAKPSWVPTDEEPSA
ncbi:MAG: methylglutaconyl-CoA hydratase [Myxococcota bacterium]|jgi:methylglutaconyl-CoA hydratase